jgi:hypothetical protein
MFMGVYKEDYGGVNDDRDDDESPSTFDPEAHRAAELEARKYREKFARASVVGNTVAAVGCGILAILVPIIIHSKGPASQIIQDNQFESWGSKFASGVGGAAAAAGIGGVLFFGCQARGHSNDARDNG